MLLSARLAAVGRNGRAGANRSGLRAGTLSGNPIAMAAGFACLTEVAQPGIHQNSRRTGRRSWQNGLLETTQKTCGYPLVVNHVGGMFGIFFTEAKP